MDTPDHEHEIDTESRPEAVRSTDRAIPGEPQRRAEPAHRARGRLLKIAVFGGSLLGAYLGQIAGILSGDPTGGLVSLAGLLSVLAGSIVGYLLGLGLFALVHSRDPEQADRWGGHVWVLLATPAYLLAGTVAGSVVSASALSGMADIGATLGSILVVLLLAWVVLAPLTLAFAPSTTGQPKLMHRHLVGCSGTFWVGGFTALWFGGSFFAVLYVLAALESAFPVAYGRAADSSLLSIPMIVAWLALWIGGAAAVYRLLKRLLRSSTDRPSASG